MYHLLHKNCNNYSNLQDYTIFTYTQNYYYNTHFSSTWNEALWGIAFQRTDHIPVDCSRISVAHFDHVP